jgi:hypothetical protein
VTDAWLHRVTEARPSAADPRILRGDLASGEEVWASLRGPAAQEVLQRSDKILAIENEAAGMCSAVEELPNAPDALIVKGISDTSSSPELSWPDHRSLRKRNLRTSSLNLGLVLRHGSGCGPPPPSSRPCGDVTPIFYPVF